MSLKTMSNASTGTGSSSASKTGNVWLDLLRDTAASRSKITNKSTNLVVLGTLLTSHNKRAHT